MTAYKENTGTFLDTLKEPELELMKIEKTLNDDCIQRMDGFSPLFMAFEAVIEKHPVVHQDLETEQNDQYGYEVPPKMDQKKDQIVSTKIKMDKKKEQIVSTRLKMDQKRPNCINKDQNGSKKNKLYPLRSKWINRIP